VIPALVVAAVENHRGTPIAFELTLLGTDGQEVRITPGFQRAEQLRDLVLERMKPGMVAAGRSNTEVAFRFDQPRASSRIE
jgi:hypothetical protein